MTQRQQLLTALLVGAAMCVGYPAGADLPAAEARLDTHEVTLGDTVGVRLELRCSTDQEPLPPDLGVWLDGFSPETRGVRKAESADSVRVWQFAARIQLFEPGEHRVPGLDVRFLTASGDTLVRRTGALAVKVIGVREQGDQEPRDIKPPVPVPGGIPLWLVILGGLVVVLAAVALVYRWMMRRPAVEPAAPEPEPVDYAAEFVRIAGLGLLERGEYKQYYSMLADNLRRYLEQRAGIDAMEQTTEQIAAQLENLELTGELLGDVKHFLTAADLVKFARMVPDTGAARRVPEDGIALIQRMDSEMASREGAAGAGQDSGCNAAVSATSMSLDSPRGE